MTSGMFFSCYVNYWRAMLQLPLLSCKCCLPSVFIAGLGRFAVRRSWRVALGWHSQTFASFLCIGNSPTCLSWMLQVQQKSAVLTASWLTKRITSYQLLNNSISGWRALAKNTALLDKNFIIGHCGKFPKQLSGCKCGPSCVEQKQSGT